jgi:hypothetical protein
MTRYYKLMVLTNGRWKTNSRSLPIGDAKALKGLCDAAGVTTKIKEDKK